MATEPLLIELTDPIPSAVRLPGIGGTIEGEVTGVEIQPDCGEIWIRVKIPVWQRWRTQLAVGQKAVHGIGPARTEMWAPAAAVEIDVDEMPGFSKLIGAHRAAAV
jgi:hypothetical protein